MEIFVIVVVVFVHLFVQRFERITNTRAHRSRVTAGEQFRRASPRTQSPVAFTYTQNSGRGSDSYINVYIEFVYFYLVPAAAVHYRRFSHAVAESRKQPQRSIDTHSYIYI